jgi:hypothetical protein
MLDKFYFGVGYETVAITKGLGYGDLTMFLDLHFKIPCNGKYMNSYSDSSLGYRAIGHAE